MLEDEYNEMYRDRVMIAIENKTAPYFASLQIDCMKETAHANIHVVPSESSEEDEDDDQFFKQKPPQDNMKFIIKIWKDLKKTYKLVKGLHKEKVITTTYEEIRSKGAGTSKRGRRS